MTTTKSVPVSRRTCSASGCSTAAGSGAVSAVATSGAAARVRATPSTSSSAESELAATAFENAATPAPSSTTRTTTAWIAKSCEARLQPRGPCRRAPSRGPRAVRESVRPSSPTAPPAPAPLQRKWLSVRPCSAPKATLAPCGAAAPQLAQIRRAVVMRVGQPSVLQLGTPRPAVAGLALREAGVDEVLEVPARGHPRHAQLPGDLRRRAAAYGL